VKTTTIFKQLILNVIIPVVVALIILGGLNYYNTKKLLDEFNESENKAITEEIYQYLSLQDLALEVIEIDLDERMKYLSSILVEQFEKNLDSIEAINLEKIGREIGLNLETEDIYIINKHGIVVNTTFTKDLHLDFFSFGEEHKNMLLGVLSDSVFKSERFAIENTTRRIKKYSYQPTKNGEYIIELGVYSHKADEINNKVRNTIESISGLHKSIVSVGLFMGSDNPFSLNKDVDLCDYQRQIIINQLKSEKDTSFRRIDGDVVYNYDYLYMDRDNTDLYKNAVIRIVSDRSEQKKYLLFELIKLLLIFLVTIFAVAYIIYQKTKIITTPIKRLVENVTRIAGGNFNERALVEGNNEVAKLSAHFNYMLEKIEEYYKELEQKVEERTHEVVQQKEEIETQRDDLAQKNEHLELAYSKIEAQNKHITDSINYAQRIQRAILPPEILINSIIPDSFIYYKPKDIVSGDFYWMSHSESVDLIAAVDCTGHGVPGAFMSIIGKENLNHVVNVRKNTEPNII
jgi:phosphoserine phosphatase RsbU/P